MDTILLCSDLDRTILPNGEEDESEEARVILGRLAKRPELCLAYVSGRDKNLVAEAIEQYLLPEPDFVIGDVGTTLYRVDRDGWHLDETWQGQIALDWQGRSCDDIVSLLGEQEGMDMTLQPQHKQNRYKVSYYTAPDEAGRKLEERVRRVLAERDIKATVIWSRDEAKQRGLLDILPRRANKLEAIRFLMDRRRIGEDRVVFAGDSGNDLAVLTSGLQAILVKNASADVRREAQSEVERTGHRHRLYLAKGGTWGMNGNYSAGVIEGLNHFFPETAEWVQAALDEID